MGNNYSLCGCPNVSKFVEYQGKGEMQQLILFCRFIKSSPTLTTALRKHDWTTFARTCNGPPYKANKYDIKLSNAYKKFS